MKIRGIHVVVLIVIVAAGLVTYGVMSVRVGPPQPGVPAVSTTPATQAPSEDKFIEEVEKLRDASPSTQEAGTLPPVQGDAGDVPLMVVEPAGVLDMGVVSRTMPTTGEIRLRNDGKKTLTITQVKSSCGCTQAKIDESAKIIEPGQTSVVKVTVDPFKIYGFEAEKVVTIMSNDPSHASVPVKVRAKVDPEFSVDPPSLEFGEWRKGVPFEKTIIIRQLADEPMDITEVKPNKLDSALQLTMEPRPENEWATPGKKEFAVKLRLADDVSPGDYTERLDIMTTYPRIKRFMYTVKGKVTSFYTVEGKTPVMLRNYPADPQFRTSKVTIKADRAFELGDIKASSEDVVVTTEPGQTPNVAVLELKLVEGVKPGRRNENVSFTLKSADETLKDRIDVRVFASGPSAGRPATARSAAPPAAVPGGQS